MQYCYSKSIERESILLALYTAVQNALWIIKPVYPCKLYVGIGSMGTPNIAA